MNKQKGIVSTLAVVMMLVMAVALPITTKLVQQNQENRSNAAAPIPIPTPFAGVCLPNPAENCAFYGLSSDQTPCEVITATSCGAIKCYERSCVVPTVGCVPKTCADYGLSTDYSCYSDPQSDGCGGSMACYNCTSTIKLTPTLIISTCARCSNNDFGSKGDATCDGIINESDFAIWLSEYQKGISKTADFNCSGSVGIDDFSIWNKQFYKIIIYIK